MCNIGLSWPPLNHWLCLGFKARPFEASITHFSQLYNKFSCSIILVPKFVKKSFKFLFLHLFQNYPVKIGANQYPCPYCPKGFTRKANLERHISLHTGDKPFACTLCDYSVSRKDQLNIHVQSKHNLSLKYLMK